MSFQEFEFPEVTKFLLFISKSVFVNVLFCVTLLVFLPILEDSIHWGALSVVFSALFFVVIGFLVGLPIIFLTWGYGLPLFAIVRWSLRRFGARLSSGFAGAACGALAWGVFVVIYPVQISGMFEGGALTIGLTILPGMAIGGYYGSSFGQ